MVNTHMACGVIHDDLLVRVGKENYEDARARGGEEMNFTGRPMRSMVVMPRDALASGSTLDDWVAEGVTFAPLRAAEGHTPEMTADLTRLG